MHVFTSLGPPSEASLSYEPLRIYWRTESGWVYAYVQWTVIDGVKEQETYR